MCTNNKIVLVLKSNKIVLHLNYYFLINSRKQFDSSNYNITMFE